MTEMEQRLAGGMEALHSLERLGAATSTSLDLPADLTYERYEALGTALGRTQRTVAWMIGDWINFGEHAYGQKYAQAVLVLKMTEETLMNYASICRKVPRERRREELPFSVHAAVASLPPTEQTEWLEAAVVNDWRREELRARLRPSPPAGPHAGVMPNLEEAAAFLVDSAVVMGDGYLVRESAFRELAIALGREV